MVASSATEDDPCVYIFLNENGRRELRTDEIPITAKNFAEFVKRCKNCGLSEQRISRELIYLIKSYIPTSAKIHTQELPALEEIYTTEPDKDATLEADEILDEDLIGPYNTHEPNLTPATTEGVTTAYPEPRLEAKSASIPVGISTMANAITVPMLAPIPRFGKDPEREILSNFIGDFENYLARNNITDNKLKISYLQSALDGEVYEMVCQRTTGENRIDNYDTLKAELISIFGKSLTRQQAQYRINNAEKRPDQTRTSYATTLNRWAKSTNPAIADVIVAKKWCQSYPKG